MSASGTSDRELLVDYYVLLRIQAIQPSETHENFVARVKPYLRKLIFANHPDKAGGPEKIFLFCQAKAAWDILLNENRRKDYDNSIQYQSGEHRGDYFLGASEVASRITDFDALWEEIKRHYFYDQQKILTEYLERESEREYVKMSFFETQFPGRKKDFSEVHKEYENLMESFPEGSLLRKFTFSDYAALRFCLGGPDEVKGELQKYLENIHLPENVSLKKAVEEGLLSPGELLRFSVSWRYQEIRNPGSLFSPPYKYYEIQSVSLITPDEVTERWKIFRDGFNKIFPSDPARTQAFSLLRKANVITFSDLINYSLSLRASILIPKITQAYCGHKDMEWSFSNDLYREIEKKIDHVISQVLFFCSGEIPAVGSDIVPFNTDLDKKLKALFFIKVMGLFGDEDINLDRAVSLFFDHKLLLSYIFKGFSSVYGHSRKRYEPNGVVLFGSPLPIFNSDFCYSLPFSSRFHLYERPSIEDTLFLNEVAWGRPVDITSQVHNICQSVLLSKEALKNLDQAYQCLEFVLSLREKVLDIQSGNYSIHVTTEFQLLPSYLTRLKDVSDLINKLFYFDNNPVDHSMRDAFIFYGAFHSLIINQREPGRRYGLMTSSPDMLLAHGFVEGINEVMIAKLNEVTALLSAPISSSWFVIFKSDTPSPFTGLAHAHSSKKLLLQDLRRSSEEKPSAEVAGIGSGAAAGAGRFGDSDSDLTMG